MKDVHGEPADLNQASVKFKMREQASRKVRVSAAADIVSEDGGRVRYQWRMRDMAKAGVFEAEWEVTFKDGSIQTFPNYEYILVRVVEDVS